jgi:hypothetical protein
VYRINAILRALIEDRDPPVVKFRDGDHFQPTAALLKELSEKMRSRGESPSPARPPSSPGDACAPLPANSETAGAGSR